MYPRLSWFLSLVCLLLLGASHSACDAVEPLGEDDASPAAGEADESSTHAISSMLAARASLEAGTLPEAVQVAAGAAPSQGTLLVTRGETTWELPLVHTDVDAEIAGFVADIEVRQLYANPFDEPIEAVYLFPLPDDAAVDAMEMRIGDRVIVGEIKRREEARALYEEARDAGQTAALLDQERPNVFQQSVANILPGEAIEISLHVVQPLDYEDGGYEWVFPMVVGPRFVPAQGTGSSGAEGAREDAERLAAPVSEERTGNDISLSVYLDAGVPIQGIRSPSHAIDLVRDGDRTADLAITPEDSIPNKDFILRYEVAGSAPDAALLTHRSGESGYFLLMIQPQADEALTRATVTPKEMVFVVDTSCSMSGEPLSKAKEAMELAISEMNPDDSFYVMDFNSTVSSLATRPLTNTKANRERGLRFVQDFQGEGGTNMVEGIKASLDLPTDPELLRTVLFMTDGYIGNESEILAAVEERLGESRLYSFGVGGSVNRYLLDRMAKVGRGHVQYVRQDEDSTEAIEAFYDRIRNPVLTDIDIEWEGVEVLDLYPDPVPDLFAGQPLVLLGRYEQAGEGIVRIRGRIRGEEHVQELKIDLPEQQSENQGLASLWARRVIEDLEARQVRSPNEAITEEITELALEHRLMSRYTSFVAVEEQIVTDGDGPPRRVRVPLETPQGVDHTAIFDTAGEGGRGLMGSGIGGGGSAAVQGMGGLGTRGSGRGASGYGSGQGYFGKKQGKAAEGSPPRKARRKYSPPSPPSAAPAVVSDEDTDDRPAAVSTADIQLRQEGDWSRLDGGKVLRDLEARLGTLREAWRQAAAADSASSGRWVVALDVNRDGKVTAVRILQDSLGNSELARSLKELSARWWVTAPVDGRSTTFEIEFTFSP